MHEWRWDYYLAHHYGSPLLEYVYRVLFIEYGKDYLAQSLQSSFSPSLVIHEYCHREDVECSGSWKLRAGLHSSMSGPQPHSRPI